MCSGIDAGPRNNGSCEGAPPDLVRAEQCAFLAKGFDPGSDVKGTVRAHAGESAFWAHHIRPLSTYFILDAAPSVGLLKVCGGLSPNRTRQRPAEAEP